MPKKQTSGLTSRVKIVTNTAGIPTPPKINNSKDKLNRKLIMSINLFLLGRDKMRDTYWTIACCDYKIRDNQLIIGVSSVDNKLGTTLKNMRSHAGELARYMKDQGLTQKLTKITFEMYKPEEISYLEKLNNLIDSVELNLNLSNNKDI